MNQNFNFFYLDPIFEPISTPEHLLDLNQIPKFVLVPEQLTLESKLTISPNHIQLLDKDMK